MEMTGCAITLLLCGASVGGVAYLWILGYLYDTYGPTTFLYLLLGGFIVLTINATLLTISVRNRLGKYDTKKSQCRDLELLNKNKET